MSSADTIVRPEAADPVRRAFEIEDPTNLYFIHPISARLVPIFARLGLTPNAVSLIGMGCGVLAGLSYAFYRQPLCALAGFVLMLAWHVMDGADGQLARLTKAYSELGKVLDGICDYVTFAAVYAGLALALSTSLGGWAWALVAVAALCHAGQSAAYELQRQSYNVWGWGRQSAALPAPGPLPANLPWRARIAARLHRLYARLQVWVGGDGSAFDRAFAAMLAAQPSRQAALRQEYRAYFAPIIRLWGVLSSNYRTIGIFLAALLKVPALYFGLEIIGFSLVLVLLLQMQKAQKMDFLKRLRQAERRRQPLMAAFQRPNAQA